jgi:hypothetical protein
MIKVIHAEYHKGYEILVEFNDGVKGVVDLEADLWGVVFEPLREIGLFKQFEVSPLFKTIVWPNGADLAPEYLYSKVQVPA